MKQIDDNLKIAIVFFGIYLILSLIMYLTTNGVLAFIILTLKMALVAGLIVLVMKKQANQPQIPEESPKDTKPEAENTSAFRNLFSQKPSGGETK